MPVVEGAWFYRCQPVLDEDDCPMRFWKDTSGRYLNPTAVEALLADGVTPILDGFTARNGRTYKGQIEVDREELTGRIDLVGDVNGDVNVELSSEEGAMVLAARSARLDLAPDPDLPDDTKLWAALQTVSGGTWGGCVYDVESVLRAMGQG